MLVHEKDIGALLFYDSSRHVYHDFSGKCVYSCHYHRNFVIGWL